ncbi:hypothetical protein Tco_0224787, partial [Tanacetum coccineum]
MELITPDLICPSTYQLLWNSSGDSGPNLSFDKSASSERLFSLARVSLVEASKPVLSFGCSRGDYTSSCLPSLVLNRSFSGILHLEGIWKAFGRHTRDLGSFREETDKTTDLHQHCIRISLQWLETASQIQQDTVTTKIKMVIDLAT